MPKGNTNTFINTIKLLILKIEKIFKKMPIKYLLLIPILLCILPACTPKPVSNNNTAAAATKITNNNNSNNKQNTQNKQVIPAAERTELYLPLIKGRKIGLVVNQTSMVGNTHLVDTLLKLGVEITAIFAPEHGFRGTADAGEKITNSIDPKTKLPIISLYGKNKKPSAANFNNIETIVFDIQDVGVRFYTYISTLHYVMEACAENKTPIIVLDRPNPNAHYIDGPVLEPEFKSFVGMHPIPVVYGMSIGEVAAMINGEKWLNKHLEAQLTVIPCANYTHSSIYELPIKPSPNLPNNQAIYLYPSLCFFEGTPISVGRGTNFPFQIFGCPEFKNYSYLFTPQSNEGAKNPPHLGKTCFGTSLSTLSTAQLINETRFTLRWLLQAYKEYPNKEAFFNADNFFNKLAGNNTLKQQIINGLSEADIKTSWQPKIEAFKKIREKYLYYPE